MRLRLVVTLIIGLVLIGFLPVPAQAQGPIDLVLGGEGATSWNISNIKPGGSGIKTIELHNDGSRNGAVTIWISDINETDYGGDGAALGNYLFLHLSHERLKTNIAFPAIIHELPQSASDPNHIKINLLYTGETITLVWEWKFPETGQPQNDAQGDSLSFTINYLLEELPSGGGGEGDSEPSYQILNVDILGKVTICKVSPSGRLLDSYVATDPGNNYKLELDKGTKITCTSGKVPRGIEMKVCEESPSVPDRTEIVGPAYDLIGYTHDSVSCSVTFDQPAKLTLSYDPGWLPINTSSVVVASYDAEQGWRELEPPSGSPAKLGRTTALVSHTSTFAVLAKLAPSPPAPSSPALPAHFVASDLNIMPSQEKIWESVTFMTRTGRNAVITANIANDGGQEGTHSVELKINGETVDTKEVTLAAGQIQQVGFALTGMDSGQYKVEVAELSGEFTASRIINWWLITGIVVAVGLIGWGVVWARGRKKAAQHDQQSL